jgi:hypothetical protein
MTTTIELTMTDFFTGNPVVRNIDISNFSVPDYNAADGWETNVITTDETKRIELLNNWIDERGNEQHDTILTLDSYRII